jgi:carbon storage regulator
MGLCLSRRLGEKILIGADVTVTVVDIDRNKVRLHIEAPHNVSIYRTELLARTVPQTAPVPVAPEAKS